jgi:hypothetical protein
MKQLVAVGLVGLALGAALVQPMTIVFCIIPARRATRVSPVRALTGG